MNKGEKIPDILGKDQDGREIKAIDFTGKKLVLYFYPKDSTPGCTAEACSLRDNYQELIDRGYAVVGVSCDSDTSHRRFIEKNSLPFPLITDPDHRLAEEMGVWGEKSMCGRKYFGIYRTTFIVDECGTIEQVYGPKEVKTKIHADQILGKA